MSIINTNNIEAVDFIQNRNGEYRAIIKCRAGFMTICDNAGGNVMEVFRAFKKGALQSIQFKADKSKSWLTVFARKAKKVVLMDVQMFRSMKVGDINQDWSDTNLYSQTNYALCKAKTWDDKAFMMNK